MDRKSRVQTCGPSKPVCQLAVLTPVMERGEGELGDCEWETVTSREESVLAIQNLTVPALPTQLSPGRSAARTQNASKAALLVLTIS